MRPARHQTGNVRHVDEEQRPDRIGDLPHALEIDETRVSRSTGGDHFRTAFVGQLGQRVIVDHLGLAAHAVVHHVVELARKIRLVPVGEMPAVGEVHGEDPVADGQRGEIDRGVRLAAAVRLHIGMLGPEKFLGPLDGQRLDHVDVLATAIPAPPRITLGIFVGQRGSLRLAHRAAGEIFGSDELDILELTALLIVDGGGNGRVGFLDGGDVRRFVGRPAMGGGIHGVFFSGNKWNDMGHGAFDVRLAGLIGLTRASDGICYVCAAALGCLVEAQEAGFRRHFGKKQQEHIQMIPRHGENVVGPLQQMRADRLTADIRNIDALFAQHLDGMSAGRLAMARAEAGRGDFDLVAGHVPQEALGHRAAADISSADKKDVLHEPRRPIRAPAPA